MDNDKWLEKKSDVVAISSKAKEIQDFALDIYGRYDLDKSLLWMTEEFGEVIKSIRHGDSKDDIAGELGDLSAWILCLCNILGIDYDKALYSTFEKEMKRQLKQYGDYKYWGKNRFEKV